MRNIKIINVIMILLGIRVVFSVSTLISGIKIFSDIATVTLIGCCFFKILNSSYSKKVIIFMYMMLVLSIITCYVTGQLTFFITLIILFSLKDVDIKNSIKVLHKTKILFIVIHIAIYVFCLLYLKNFVDFKIVVSNGVERHSFFLSHPNTAASILLGIFLESVYLNYEKTNSKTIITLFLLTISFLFTRSRTMMFIAVFALALLVIFKNDKKICNVLTNKKTLIYFFAFVLAFSFIPMIFFSYENFEKTDILYKIDGMLSWRFRYSNIGFEMFGIHMFPFNIDFNNTKIEVAPYVWTKLVIDNIYIKMAIHYGVIWLIVFLFIFFESIKNMNKKEIMMMYIMIFYGFSESYIINVGVMLFLFVMVDKILNKRRELND